MTACWVEGCRTVAVRHVFLVLCAEHLKLAKLSVFPEVYSEFPSNRIMEARAKYEAAFGALKMLPDPYQFAPNQQTGRPDHEPRVYFIRNGDKVKIGTTVNLTRRMSGMSLSPDAQLLATQPGSYDEEAALHQRFAADRIGRTEWFSLSLQIQAYIEPLRPPQ